MGLNCITADRISYRYPGAEQTVLKGVSCSLKKGEIAALVGPSASGKSTFGMLLKGLIEPTAGCFTATGENGGQVKLGPGARLKRVGWVGPHPELQIFGATVWEEVSFGPRNLGLKGHELAARVNRALIDAGFDPAEIASRDPRGLSGGEMRRIALAGVIAMRTSFYVFDEPAAGIDYRGRRRFISILESLRSDDCGIVLITHDTSLPGGLADRLWGLEDGSLTLDVAAEKVDWRTLTERMRAGKSLTLT